MKRIETRQTFVDRINEWAAKIDVAVRGVTVRSMRNKWGSCSMAGRLTFDESLLRQPSRVQDYVIVHELLHLRVPNHGKLWKSLMRAYLGNYEETEKVLRKLASKRDPNFNLLQHRHN